MNKKLFFQAFIKFMLGFILVGLLIFIPAGTLYFTNGWIFMGVLFIPILIAGVIMMFKNPKLLIARLDAKEKQKEQSILIKLSGLMFVFGFVLAGLDYRYKWTNMPSFIIYGSIVIFLFSYIIWAEVLRENTYLSRTIKVEKNQKVVDKGLYGIVRHPMYTATIFLFLSMPLILDSLYAFFIFLFYPILIVFRIIYEEKILEKELEGYIEYKKKVKYRLIPYIW